MSNATPPGWYQMQGDPPGTVRYWDGMQWQGEPQMQQPGAAGLVGQQRSNWGQRFGAKLIDVVLMLIPMIILIAIVAPADTSASSLDEGFDFEYSLGDSIASTIIFLIVYVGYKMACYATMGTTLGKKILGLTIVGSNGQPMTPEQQLMRTAVHAVPNLLAVVPILGGLVGVIFVLYWLIGQPIIAAISPYETLRDKISGTRVVSAR